MLIRSALSCLLLLTATAAHADTRTFVIANPDGNLIRVSPVD